jgi:hypothetical protein
MTETLPLRVMVQDAWDEVRLDLPSVTPLAELKRQALRATRVVGNRTHTSPSSAVPS